MAKQTTGEKESENLHEGHRQRLKNRALKEGLRGFEPHQILELLLFFTIPRRDTNPLAHTLLKKFGSLAAVFEAKPEELQTVPGISAHTAFFLSMIPSLARA